MWYWTKWNSVTRSTDVSEIQSIFEENKKLLRKINLILMPLIYRYYILQLLDKSQYSWTLSGAILICHSTCQNFARFIIVRFLLGVLEATITLGFSLLFTDNCIANVIGDVISYGINYIQFSLVLWRLLFLILGAIIVTYSVFFAPFLLDSLSKAQFLNDYKKIVLIQQITSDPSGATDEDIFRRYQIFEALRNPQSWLLVIYIFSVNICNSGITTLTVLTIISIIATTFLNCRIVLMMCSCSILLVGMILIHVLNNSEVYSRLASIYLAAVFAANTPMSLSLIASNIGGFIKKATVNAMLFIAYGLAPIYPVGIFSTIAGFCSGIVFLTFLLTYYKYENWRRDSKSKHQTDTASKQERPAIAINTIDKENPQFRYIL
ncbi:major facilitator superfamily domain-containing protein [Aspergillus pseudonomiae]|uniref:Major facilitator superfamily domain-containing protein n=1 Tax=Aspergillus pseudonomiae TaxID=1506151 RepID=A0A5N7DHJ8_9EURO|nr:major facilitator superfamily domain-containing protein [Aspergillus pseudonomiae]KAE8405936.1 major facilitator superfamily domain-containing protein [Aspergillus pseudonomiae]